MGINLILRIFDNGKFGAAWIVQMVVIAMAPYLYRQHLQRVQSRRV
jgi:hypothetical protein